MILLAVAFVSLPAEAQFFKKLFKKKAKTEAGASVKDDTINDDAQVALADIAPTAADYSNKLIDMMYNFDASEWKAFQELFPNLAIVLLNW